MAAVRMRECHWCRDVGLLNDIIWQDGFVENSELRIRRLPEYFNKTGNFRTAKNLWRVRITIPTNEQWQHSKQSSHNCPQVST
jgi:hypothetical protein